MALLAISFSPCAQQVPDPSPRFEVRRFEVQGNTLLSAADVERTLAPFRGADKSFADLKNAALALERAYHARGFVSVVVLLPQQDITEGGVRLRALEQRVGSVVVEGNTEFSSANVRRSLPSVREGQPPNALKLARELQLTAEHPRKQTTVVLRAGETAEEVQVAVKVVDEKPSRTFVTLDNTGTASTGYYRAGIGFQHSNLFGLDHTLTAQYVTSPTYASRVSIYGLGYRIPFYGVHGSLDLVAGYSAVDSGTVLGLFAVSGRGAIAGARWNWYLGKWGDVEQKLALGLDYRAYNNNVQFQGQGIVPDYTVHPVSATYSGLVRGAESELSFNAGFAANIPGGNDGSEADFRRSRATATSRYAILRYGAAYLHQLPGGWQGRAQFNGQYTGNALLPGEQFGLGGPDSVRGYVLREAVNDRGYSGQLELYTPDLAQKFGLTTDYRPRLVAFYDFGTIARNHALPGESQGDSIASAGVGLRVTRGTTFSLRMDFARILETTSNRDAGSLRMGATLAYSF